jgi:hypothetical protein
MANASTAAATKSLKNFVMTLPPKQRTELLTNDNFVEQLGGVFDQILAGSNDPQIMERMEAEDSGAR